MQFIDAFGISFTIIVGGILLGLAIWGVVSLIKDWLRNRPVNVTVRKETMEQKETVSGMTVKEIISSSPPELVESMGIHFELWKRTEQPQRDEKKNHFAKIRDELKEKYANVEKKLNEEYRSKGNSNLTEDELIHYSRLIQLSVEIKNNIEKAEENWQQIEPCCMQEFVTGVNLHRIPTLPAMIEAKSQGLPDGKDKVEEKNIKAQRTIVEKSTQESEDKRGNKQKVVKEKTTTIEDIQEDGRCQ